MWVQKLENGRYKYREHYKDKDGKWKKASVTLSSNSRQAENKARALLAQRIEEKRKKATGEGISFGAVASDYLEKKRKTVARDTVASYNSWVKAIFGFIDKDIPIASITVKDVDHLLEYVAESRSSSYAAHVLFLLRQMFKYSKKLGYIDDMSPVAYASLPHMPLTMAQVAKRSKKYLDKKELSYVLNQLRTISPDIALFCEFLALTGLRISEALALQVDNIDKERERLSVTGSMKRNIGKSTTKNIYSYRTISINKRAQDILSFFIEKNAAYGSDFIFKGIYIYSVNRALKKVDFRVPLSSHIFRHTHISILAELNVPLKAIMARVGHNTPKTTLEIYTHVTKSMEDNLRDKLDNISF